MKSRYVKENFVPAVIESKSYAEVCRKLELKDRGSNISTIKKYIKLYNLDISHFKGQRWNKGISYEESVSLIPLETILNKNTNYKSNSLKERLFKSGIKEAKCEICGDTECLELHHINGDHHDNRLENLQILCIKCHYKTPNYRGKNKKRNDNSLLNLYIKKEKPLCTCLNCGKEFYSDRSDKERKFCNRECYNQYLKKSSNPILIKEDILKVIDNYSDITNLGKHFCVSRTTMRKYLEMFNLLDKFKLKYEFNTKKLQQYDLNMNLIKEWPSIIDAEETLGITGISKVANGKRRSCGGFIWRFIN